ncbi:hypothetical protein B0H14DRAFT_2802334 [Mycena olivaceomarginata]|nr:hypothetical protein B0H14DRAFT_2802334 [Mycena olivaceomarginata]
MTVNFDVLIILAGLLVHAGLASTMDLNSTLFTPEASDFPAGPYIATGIAGVTLVSPTLPAGTYIATGIAGVSQLAEYLDTYPGTTCLLISDSSIQDVDAKHDHLFTDGTIESRSCQGLEALSYLAYIYYSAGLHGAIYPEWIDPRLKPLVQHNYPSLTQFDFPIHHLDGAYRVLTEAYYPPCEKADFTTHHLDNPCYVAHKASRFPSLTHLRTAGILQSSTLASTLAYVIDKFPRLTHLLVTDVGAMCELPSELYPTLRRAEILNAENLGIQYEDFILKSLRDDGVHVKLPTEDDYDTERGRFSLRRAIAEFVDRARGGEGEWILFERIPSERNGGGGRQCSDPRGYQKDRSGL